MRLAHLSKQDIYLIARAVARYLTEQEYNHRVLRMARWQVEEFKRWVEINPKEHCLVEANWGNFDLDEYTKPFPWER